MDRLHQVKGPAAVAYIVKAASLMKKTGAAPAASAVKKLVKPPTVQPWHYHTTPQRQLFAGPIAPARGQAATAGMRNPMTVTASVKLAAFFSELQKISMPKGTLENLTKLKGSPVESVAEGALKRVRTHNIGARYARTGEWPASVPKPANLKPVSVRPNVLPPKQLGPAPGGTYTGPREVTSGFGGMEKEEGFFGKPAAKLIGGGAGGASALRAGERALSTGGRVTTGVATNYTGRVMPPPRQITSLQQNIAERGISL